MTLALSVQPENPVATNGPTPEIICRIEVTSLVDERLDPAIVGLFWNQAVKAPLDREAWLKEIIKSLALRGIEPVFTADTADAPMIKTGIALEKAWVNNVGADISSSVSFRTDETGPNGTIATNHFRGSRQKMTYFSAGEGKIQRGIDSAFEQALDQMAAHFLTRCGEK